MGNRVEDLERQVAELQATVDGLTEELVETKERLRQVEEGETSAPTFEGDGGDDAGRGGDHAEFVANADRSTAVEPDDDDDESGTADAAERDAEDDGDGSGDDGDIIVA